MEAAIGAHVAARWAGLAGGPGQGGPARGKRLAGLYLRSSQFRPAELTAREYLRLDGDDAEGHRLLAGALEGAGRLGDAKALESALAEYEAAEAKDPGDIAAAERLAALHRDKFGDPAGAARVLDAMLRHNPDSARARLARSRFFAESGDADAALAEDDAAIRIAPGDVDARLAAAEIAARRDDPGAARLHLAAIRPPRPDDVRVKIIEGLIELDERKTDEAIRDWRAGLVLSGGSDAELTWRLAHVLIQLGQVREARAPAGPVPPALGRRRSPAALSLPGRPGRAQVGPDRRGDRRAGGDPLQARQGAGGPALPGARPGLRDLDGAGEGGRRHATGPPRLRPSSRRASSWLSLARLKGVDRPGEEVGDPGAGDRRRRPRGPAS